MHRGGHQGQCACQAGTIVPLCRCRRSALELTSRSAKKRPDTFSENVSGRFFGNILKARFSWSSALAIAELYGKGCFYLSFELVMNSEQPLPHFRTMNQDTHVKSSLKAWIKAWVS
jgi:hypothetical protein